MQWGSGLEVLEKRLILAGRTIQYETSGKLPLPAETRGVIVCSPKHLNGTWHFYEENLPLVDFFKFVVDDDFALVEEFIEQRKIPSEKIWIMPLGTTREEQLQRLPTFWEYCASNGFNLSSRLHTLIFNDAKGV